MISINRTRFPHCRGGWSQREVGRTAWRRSAEVDRIHRQHLVPVALALLWSLWGGAWGATPSAAQTGHPGAAVIATADRYLAPLLQEGAPIEDRIRLMMRDLLREIRRSFKLSKYFISSSPTWWWQRAKRSVWPLIFAFTALFFDTALLAEWKTDGLRVIVNYVPMMLYVYARLFVSSGTSVVVRLGVVLAFVYGVWIDDLIRDGRWYMLGKGRIDDFVVIFGAVRAFVMSCPEQLVEMYAEQAIALRGRLARSLRRSG